MRGGMGKGVQVKGERFVARREETSALLTKVHAEENQYAEPLSSCKSWDKRKGDSHTHTGTRLKPSHNTHPILLRLPGHNLRKPHVL